MAAAAARSPSPGPGRPCCAAMRRSADSSPFKLADCTQRSSSVSKNGGGGGGCGCHASPRRSFGEKENDPRDAAARTPKAARSGGGAKNFMAPTISAASKAVAAASASPRKKVLGERNEQQHHLAAPSSPADHLAQKPKGPPPPEAGATPTRRLRLSFDGVPAPAAAPEASHGSRNSFAGDDARTENPFCKSHHHAAADPVDAEAEPSRAAAVYDPKTNYLSPRPRFLHYKPNPRIEMYRHGGGGGGVRRLDEGFASESSDDDELTEEEQEQAQQKSEPDDLLEEPSDLAAPSEAGDAAAALPETLVLPPEPAASSPRACGLTPEPRAASPRARAQAPEPELAASSARALARKRSSLRFLLAAPLALILFMAAAFVCVPPPADSPLMTNAALWKVPDFLSSVQELHPVELAAWLKQWSSSSLDSITSYWEALVSTQEQEFLGPYFTANLSAAASDADHGADFYYNFAETWAMPSEELVGASVLEELKIQDVVSGSNTDLTAEPETGDVVVEEESIDDGAVDVVVEEESIEDAAVEEESIEDAAVEEESVDAASADYYKAVVEEELDVEMFEEAPDINGEEMASSSQNLDIPSQPTGEPEQRDNLNGIESSSQQDVESDESEGDHTDVKEDQEVYHGLKPDSSMWLGYLDKFSKPAAIVIAIVVVILSTAMVFLYMRQKQAQIAANANAPAEQAQQAETQSGSGSSKDHLLVKGSQFQSSVAEETERFGESEVSQYSSSLSSGHARRRKNKEEESPSLEPMSKRESTTYSTSSYGSFTTYEKISAKKRNKEDEAMTPVRRSSRLRNVKSPEA